MSESRLLADRPFIAVQPDLIRNLEGNVAAAVVLQHVHYRLTGPDGEWHDDRRWYPVKIADLADEIGMSRDQVKHVLARLRDLGLLLVSQRSGYDRTNLYAIDLDHPALYGQDERANVPNASGGSAPSKGEIRPIERADLPLAPSIQTTKTSKTIIPADAGTAADVVAAYVDACVDLHGEKPPTRNIGRLAREARQLLEEGRDVTAVIAAAQHCAAEGHANIASAYTWVKAQPVRAAARGSGKESAAAAYVRLAAEISDTRLEIGQ